MKPPRKRIVNFRARAALVDRIDKEALAADRTRSEYLCRILEALAEQSTGPMLATATKGGRKCLV